MRKKPPEGLPTLNAGKPIAIRFGRTAVTLGTQAQALVGALALASWASGACAEQARTPLNTMKDIETAIRACWIPPPIELARAGMQITVLMSFKRNGALLGRPKVTFESVGATDDERLAYRLSVAEMLKRCTRS